MNYRLTAIADDDIQRILRDTLERFGPHQVEAYAALIETSLERIGGDPFAASSSARDELGPGIRAIHFQITAGRRGASSHIAYFRPPVAAGSGPVSILRILHDRMDPKRHVIPGEP